MARVSGPFLSVSASGTVGKILTAATWKGIPYIREWFKPQNPKTAKQVAQRSRLTTAVEMWHAESADVKAAWDAYVAGQPLSGFNAYVKYIIDYHIANDSFPTAPVTPPA